MRGSIARALGAWFAMAVALVACGWLAGCAGAERLPQCKGRAVPINSLVPAAASIGASGRSAPAAAAAPVSEADAH